MTRIVAYVLIVNGLLLLGDAAYDEHRGIASAVAPGGAGSMLPHYAKRSENPESFRILMNYQWGRGPLVLAAGLWILGLCRRADRIDPFSPDFAGNRSLDELDRTLRKEQAKRHSPWQ